MSRPASAAWYRCQTSVFSLSGSAANPSAYICTTAASSTRSRRYVRSAAGAAVGADVEVFGVSPLPQATVSIMVMTTASLFSISITVRLSRTLRTLYQLDLLEMFRDMHRPALGGLDSRGQPVEPS